MMQKVEEEKEIWRNKYKNKTQNKKIEIIPSDINIYGHNSFFQGNDCHIRLLKS